MPVCPSLFELERFNRGLLSGPVGQQVRAHLDSCETCRSALRNSSGTRSIRVDATMAPLDATQAVSDVTVAATAAEKPRDKHFPDIEGYQILGILGQGGMGVVYRAVQIKLNRVVALKVLPGAFGESNPTAVARFRREATSAARLHHTHIIPVYDFGESPHAYYYAMELIEGHPLTDVVRRYGDEHAASAPRTRASEKSRVVLDLSTTTPPASSSTAAESSGSRAGGSPLSNRAYFQRVARWMTDVADALNYAHGEGVIHRDIKPANLILSHDGRIMIADFGLAKTAEEQSVTIAGSFLGTLRYASPEQAMGKGDLIDHRTDIYSLGATMYELLCFQPAYPATSQKELVGAILNTDPTPPRRINPSVPHELEIICLKVLEKSANSRYATAKGLADDLRRFLNDIPISARRPSLVSRAVKFSRRHRALVTAIGAACLLAVSTALLVRAQAGRRRAEAEQRLAVAEQRLAEKNQRVAEVKSLYESGMFFTSNAKWDKAETEFNKALTLDPNNVKALLALVWMKIEYYKKHPELASVGALEELDGLCQRILEIDPNQLNALSYHSIVLKNLNRYEEAIAATRKVIEIQPDFYAAWSNLGAYHALIGDLDAALTHLRHGAAEAEKSTMPRSVDQATVWRNLAALELYLGHSNSIEHIRQAIEAKPDDIPSWLLLVRARLGLDGHVDIPEALDDAKHVDRLAPQGNGKAKRLRALAHLRSSDWEAATVHAGSAVALGDAVSFNHLILGMAEAGQKNLVAAREHFAAAAEAWPAELSNKPFIATFDEGILWFESAAEWSALREEAALLIDVSNP